MVVKRGMPTVAICVAIMGFASAAEADCKGPPLYFNGSIAELESPLLVKAGAGCAFGINGFPGAVSEVKITQAPKIGRAGVQNLRAIYIAKPGYQGADELTYAIIGTNDYGGPMRITIKQKITVIPSL